MAVLAMASSALVSVSVVPAAAAVSTTKVADFTLQDQNAQSHELYKLGDAKAVVLITQMNGCPIVRNILPALNTLKATYEPKGVKFLMLNSSKQDSRDDVVAEAKDWSINFPILLDSTQAIGKRFGVERTAEVIVINPKTWQVIYHGPIDDRVTYERQKAKAEHTWAADALDATLAGKSVKIAQRQTQGCLINFD
ncbi:MAG TPA: redoxin domain-containing protein [Caulobacteraceae bacterium]|nr:redoxin domain-containing protein [Caulobacteraceae bacterium]